MNVARGNNGLRYRHNSDDTTPSEAFSIDRFTPIIRAEIAGVNLSAPLSIHQMWEVYRALTENPAIFFRDQSLTAGQHVSGMRGAVRPGESLSRWAGRGA